MTEIKLTKEQEQAVAINELAIKRTLERRGKPAEPVRKNYVNKTAAEACFFMGMNPNTQYGIPLSKAYEEYYGVKKAFGDFSSYYAGLTNWNRNDLITGARAKEYWDLVFDYSSEFVKKITFKSGDELTYPLDIWAGVEENLIDSLAVGSQPTGAQLKERVGVIGKELFATRKEDQFNLPELDIMNNLYNPNFENDIVAKRLIMLNNDLLRLWLKGTSDDYTGVAWATYTRDDMYKLGIGWIKILQDGNGSWTNSNTNAIVIGALGDRVTANKIKIDGIGWINKYTGAFGTVDGWVGIVSTVSAESGPVLRINLAGYARKDGIEVVPNSKCIFAFVETGEDGANECYGEVRGSDGTILGASEEHIGAGATTHTIPFFSGNNVYVELRIYQGAAKYTEITNAPTVTCYKASRTGDDIIDLMNLMIRNQPQKYKDPAKTTFHMGLTDVELYANAKGADVRIVNGVAVGVNTDTKDRWRMKGEIPRHNGYEVTYIPYMDSISENKSYGGVSLPGSIIFCETKDLWSYGLDKIRRHREEKARATSGGSGIEFTDVIFTDAQTAPNERFGIAFYGAVCETVVMMATGKIKSTPWTDAAALTKAVDYVYPYCDTKDAIVIVAGSNTSLATAVALLVDYTTATASGTIVAIGSLADGKTAIVKKGVGHLIDEFAATKTYYAYRAFKLIDGVAVLGDSTIVSVNCD